MDFFATCQFCFVVSGMLELTMETFILNSAPVYIGKDIQRNSYKHSANHKRASLLTSFQHCGRLFFLSVIPLYEMTRKVVGSGQSVHVAQII